MIIPPPFLRELSEAIRDGQPVDYRRLAQRQAIAVGEIDEQYVIDASRAKEEANEQFRQLFDAD